MQIRNLLKLFDTRSIVNFYLDGVPIRFVRLQDRTDVIKTIKVKAYNETLNVSDVLVYQEHDVYRENDPIIILPHNPQYVVIELYLYTKEQEDE